jgi:hypothetical protein
LARTALESVTDASVAVQMVRYYDEEVTESWQASWEGKVTGLPWIWGNLVYHEAVGLAREGKLAIWDPSANRWCEPYCECGNGAVLAVRLLHGSGISRTPLIDGTLRWDANDLCLNQWCILPFG